MSIISEYQKRIVFFKYQYKNENKIFHVEAFNFNNRLLAKNEFNYFQSTYFVPRLEQGGLATCKL